MNITCQGILSIFISALAFLVSGCEGGPAKFTLTTTTAATTVKHTISGVVSGTTSSGAPIALAGDMVMTTTTDSHGSYLFSDIPDGSYTVTPTLVSYRFTPANTSVTISGADVANVDFSDVGDFDITGAVSGSAVQGVTLVLSGATNTLTTTDVNGSYRFSGLDSGTYILTPGLNGHSFVSASTVVTITNANRTNLDFASMTNIGSLYSISGNVSGGPLKDAEIWLTGPTCAGVRADASGNYMFTGLPSGTYMVRARIPCYSASQSTFIININTASVTSIDFIFTASSCNSYGGIVIPGSISGTVSGTVQQGVTMILTGDTCLTTTTDVNGRYSFDYYYHGNYTVTPSLVGYTFSPANRNMYWAGGILPGIDFTAP
jgi:hypothetical protein